jgi:hypothetical protein
MCVEPFAHDFARQRRVILSWPTNDSGRTEMDDTTAHSGELTDNRGARLAIMQSV